MTDYADPAAFTARFHRFRYSAFRLETLQSYRDSGEDALPAAFQAGATSPPPDPARDEWDDLLHTPRQAGRIMQRVHVVAEPFSDYLRYELTWAYGPSVAAGEDIRIIAATESTWPDDLPRRLDFWLFDASELFVVHYDADDALLGFEPVTDPGAIVLAGRWRDAALHHARPWADWITDHPDLAAHVPGDVTRAG